jgi:U3 small nucleolar RNA-associated protein 15
MASSSYAPIDIARARRPISIAAATGPFRYRQPTVFRLKAAAPSSIEFSPVAPYDFAAASSLQVDLFSTETNAVYRTLSRFKDVVRCASYRHDGKMLAAGDEKGCTQLFDLGSRAVMRTFTGHSKAVHVARFAGDGSRLFTASDDGRALCWDVAAEAQLCALEGHTDFVRSGALSPASPHTFATGSYDHSVKLWDVKSARCVMTLRHVAPVEDLVLLPGGALLASASGSTLTVWDLLTGRILQAVSVSGLIPAQIHPHDRLLAPVRPGPRLPREAAFVRPDSPTPLLRPRPHGPRPTRRRSQVSVRRTRARRICCRRRSIGASRRTSSRPARSSPPSSTTPPS